MFRHADFDDHEQVVFARDVGADLRAIVAVHSTVCGPAFGGCRMWPYRNDDEALSDALRLSRGMTYKATICELPYGGGKSVIIGDPRRAKTRALLLAMGRVVDRLGGRYVIADDIGTSLEDLRIMRAATAHTRPRPWPPASRCGHRVRGAPGARAAAAHLLGRSDLEGLRVAVRASATSACRFAATCTRPARSSSSPTSTPARVADAERAFGARPVQPMPSTGRPWTCSRPAPGARS